MMTSQAYRAFREELVKIAGVSLDAGTRANMAGRVGKEYLPGGQLASNHQDETNFVPKIAAEGDAPTFRQKVRKARRKFQKTYKKVRKPGAAAARGALYGGLIANILSGGRAKSGYGAYTTPALIGAGAGLADYYAQKKPKKRKKMKVAMLGSDTFTPGRSLSQSGSVGSFQDKVVHKGDRLRPPTLGQRFAIPSAPTTR